MEFITVRDLRVRPGQVWKRLAEKRDVIVTSNGRPIAVLSAVSEGNVDETLIALRRARAQMAVSHMRQSAAAQGLDQMTMDEIDEEIRRARQERQR